MCRPYRAQTKGKVESGVKYVKGNFLPGREFRDLDDFNEQLTAWSTDIADQRIHGTTHERPIERFAREAGALTPLADRAGFLAAMSRSRVVASDWLVSIDTIWRRRRLAKHRGRPLQHQTLPLRDLVRVYLEVLGQFRQRPIATDRR